VNTECGCGHIYNIVLDTNMNMDMDMDTRYGMLLVPYCLSITLVFENYKRGGRYEKIKIFLLGVGKGYENFKILKLINF